LRVQFSKLSPLLLKLEELALVFVDLNFSFLLLGMRLELRLGTRQLVLPSTVKEKLLQNALHLTQYRQTSRDRHLSDH